MSRALEKLRKFFAKRGVDSTAATIAGTISANSVQAAPVALAKTVTAVALAKGAAASTSTLTLIKGALKIMAWTKAKTAVVATAVVLLATAGTVSVWHYYRHGPPAQAGRLRMRPGNTQPMVAYSYSRVAILLATDGSLWSWGENRLGWPVLGLSDKRQNTASLRRIGNDNDWVSVAAGDAECLAIKADGTLWAWGENLNYQLGDGTKITRATPVRSIPGNHWKQAASGGTTSYAIKTDGTLWAWGNNWAGQLGTGNTKAVTNAVQVGTDSNWERIWAEGGQVLGLQTDGSLWFWGSLDGNGRGTNTIKVPTRVSPDTNWVDACFGYFTMFAIKSDGTLWCWGNTARFYTHSGDTNVTLTPMPVGDATDWLSCNSGPNGFYQLLRKKDGSLWAMDASAHRIVKPDSQYPPIKFEKLDFPKGIASYVAGGDDIGIVISTDGEVWTWGRVMGELTQKDFYDAKGHSLYPKSRTISKPWRVSFVE